MRRRLRSAWDESYRAARCLFLLPACLRPPRHREPLYYRPGLGLEVLQRIAVLPVVVRPRAASGRAGLRSAPCQESGARPRAPIGVPGLRVPLPGLLFSASRARDPFLL